MKYLLITIIFIFSTTSFAKTYNAINGSDTEFDPQEKIILEALFRDIGLPHQLDITKKEAIPDKPIAFDKEEDKEDEKERDVPTIKPTIEPKKISKGESTIERIKRENRERIKKMQTEEKRKKLYSKIEKRGFYSDLKNQKRKSLSNLKKKKINAMTNFKKTIKETHQLWKEKQIEFRKNLKFYKKAMFSIEKEAIDMGAKPITFSKKPLQTKLLKTLSPNDFHIIKGAMNLPIRDQGRRATCAAFSGIRALETIFASHNIFNDLSEQYFYWSSKPYCQKNPCKRKGSWVTPAFKNSQNSKFPDIPLEKSCPYKTKNKINNETQIPLIHKCTKGYAKITNYKRIKSFADTIRALNRGEPIIAGFKLSPNFYFTKGLVTLKDAKMKGNLDSHAQGHAVLLIGHIKLPKKLHSSEGKICLITANSWGQGWGSGGYGCLTENWIKHYKVKNAFISVTSTISSLIKDKSNIK